MTGASTSRARTWLSAAASAGRVSPVPAGCRQAMNRSGRTRTAPSLAIWRWRNHLQRGSYRSPSRCPIRTVSIGTFAPAARCRAASHQAWPSSPAISRNRPGATRSLTGRRLPSSSSIQAWGSGAPGRVDGWYTRTSPAGGGRDGTVGDDGRGSIAGPVFDIELAELHRLRPHCPQDACAVRGVFRPAAPHPAQLLHVLPGRVLVGDAEFRGDPEMVDRVLQ